MKHLRIGTRGSLLARTQTDWVAAELRRLHPEIEVEIKVIRTTGDANQTSPFSVVGTKGMFVKELEEALLIGDIDCAVHSLKDMPSDLPEGLIISCIPDREDPRDAYLSPHGLLSELLVGAIVGTSSPRRKAQLLDFRADLDVRELRGNLDTRLRKLDEGQYQAIILACAGLERLGLAQRITERLPVEVFTPAPGQGALAIETRSSDIDMMNLLKALNNPKVMIETSCERAFQLRLAGGCGLPAGAFCKMYGDSVTVIGMLQKESGTKPLRLTLTGAVDQAENLGKLLAEELLS